MSIDFKKAFDSINREVTFKILALYGILEKIIKAIRELYTNKVKSNHSRWRNRVDIVAGVLQADTLDPFLFIIVYVLCISMDKNNTKGLLLKPGRSTRHPAEYITDLDFADDLALPSNNNTSNNYTH